MTITTIEIVKLTPSEGYILTNGTIYREVVYLTQPASPENWHEIDAADVPAEPQADEYENTEPEE